MTALHVVIACTATRLGTGPRTWNLAPPPAHAPSHTHAGATRPPTTNAEMVRTYEGQWKTKCLDPHDPDDERWRVLMGISPMNSNERQRPSLAWLRQRVAHLPINGPVSELTVASMKPYFQAAIARRHVYNALGEDMDPCESDDDCGDEDADASDDDGGELDDAETTVRRVRVRKAPQLYQ